MRRKGQSRQKIPVVFSRLEIPVRDYGNIDKKIDAALREHVRRISYFEKIFNKEEGFLQKLYRKVRDFFF
jgi:hypothetical protein